MRASNEASTSIELANSLFRGRSEVTLDLIAAVKGLHELSPQQLGKLIKDSGNNVVRHIAEDGSCIQVDLEKFARYLPLHLIAVIMAWERDKSTFKYLLCGILLLHSMCDLASRVPKIEQILLDDVKISEQLIDLVFYLLVLLGAYKQETHTIPNDMVLLHSALVACSLKLLTVIVSPQYQEVDIFMEAAFSAVCVDVKFLQTKLSAQHGDSSGSASPTAEETLNHLCQQCDSSLQFLQSLCQQKLFRECVVKNKELCGNGGVLVLVQAVMNLKLSGSDNTSSYLAATSRLKSKALSILLHLCEAESVSYLDEVASNTASQDLAKSVGLEVLDLLKKLFGIDSTQLNAPSEVSYPKGQLELNAMRLADVFSDDSNFRSFIMINFREALAAIFLLPHGEFVSGWCSSDLLVSEEDAPLDVPRSSYAHQRTSLLIKVIANLHCFNPDVCQDEKDLFLNKFIQFIQNDYQKLSDGFLSTSEADKVSTVSKNLCSLLSHAESLVPEFLNEDDVQLLRLFISQFESRIVRAASEGHLVNDEKNAVVYSLPLHREISPGHGNNVVNMGQGTLNLGFREVDQFDATRNGDEQFFDRKNSGMMEQDKSNGASVNSRDNEKDAQAFDTSGSDSSPTRGKIHFDQMGVDRIKRHSFDETAEEEKIDPLHSEEKQQRKRKRTVMNDKQIALIESALIDEPDMHRNAPVLRLWADKLSIHGAEVTTSRLKNWLNNRKARLARAAKDARVSYDGDSADRLGISGQLDSPRSSMDDAHISFSARGNIADEVTNIAVVANADEDLGTPCAAPMDIEVTDIEVVANTDEDLGTSRAAPMDIEVPDIEVVAETDEDLGTSRAAPTDIATPSLSFGLGQYVMLVDERGGEVGKGVVFQISGQWCGKSLYNSGMCVVDIKELSVDKSSNVLHPVEGTCDSFYQTEERFGLIRVLWDVNKVFLYFQPGEYVMLRGDKQQEIGKGTVFQARGYWNGVYLEQSGMCVVDIKKLSIDRFADLPHPVEATGNSFYQSQKRIGVMRVLWDSNKLSRLQAYKRAHA
ncbi:nodulin homeobox-like isoform X3 [Salvia hispanica]|uniref:nodulin homeobox-like isoform X3 n=1 Tax=Salvia hispanica TaxID=49212 RepID=UPI0020090CD9|nr:nodulin homeobox-like isoform X3 [Salvia hispanica]